MLVFCAVIIERGEYAAAVRFAPRGGKIVLTAGVLQPLGGAEKYPLASDELLNLIVKAVKPRGETVVPIADKQVAQPQKIILRGIGVICRSVDDRTVGRRCAIPSEPDASAAFSADVFAVSVDTRSVNELSLCEPMSFRGGFCALS